MADPVSELARQYDPTSGVADWRERLEAWSRAADEARASLAHQADVRFGPGAKQLIDVFPAAPGAAGVIFIHGGYWRALSKSIVAGVAGALVPAGLASIHVGYDLCPNVTVPQIVDEIDDALRWCAAKLETYGVDKSRLVVAGSSAGAHLAAMAIAAEGGKARHPGIVGAFLSSGLYDLEPLLSLPVGAALGLDRESVGRMSPIHHPPPAGLPVAIQVGGEESPAWREQSRRYFDHCRAAGVQASFSEIQGAHHFAIGLGIPGSPGSEALVAAALAWTQ